MSVIRFFISSENTIVLLLFLVVRRSPFCLYPFSQSAGDGAVKGIAMTFGQEFAVHTGDVVGDVEILRMVMAFTCYYQLETAVAFGE